MSSTLEAIYLSASAGGAINSPERAELRAGCGIVGDRYFVSEGGDGIDQVTLISKNSLLEAFELIGYSDPDFAIARRNLLIAEAGDLEDLVGREFSLGSVRLCGTEVADPCGNLARALEAAASVPVRQAYQSMLHRSGIRARILSGGWVQVGDRLQVH